MFVLRPPDKVWFLLGESASACLQERCHFVSTGVAVTYRRLCGSTACFQISALAFISCMIAGQVTWLALASVFSSVTWDNDNSAWCVVRGQNILANMVITSGQGAKPGSPADRPQPANTSVWLAQCSESFEAERL